MSIEVMSYITTGIAFFTIIYTFIKDKKNNVATMLKESETRLLTKIKTTEVEFEKAVDTSAKSLRIELVSKAGCATKMEPVPSMEEMVKTLFSLVKELTMTVKELTKATNKISEQNAVLQAENKLRREYLHEHN